MKSIVTSVFAALLFVLLTPGVVLRLPPKGDKWTVLMVHAFVFFILYYLFHGMIYKYFNPGFRQGFKSKNSNHSDDDMKYNTTKPGTKKPNTTKPNTTKPTYR
jgi:hypothetical protein